MNIAKALIGLVIISISSVAFSGSEICPAIDCDCESIQEPKLQGLCNVHERAISQECAANNGKPLHHCRMHGPAAFPVALSVSSSNLRAPVLTSAKGELEAKTERMVIAIWSLEEDLRTLKAYSAQGNQAKAQQVSKIFATNARKLFLQQRDLLLSVNQQGKADDAVDLALEYDKAWQKLSAELEAQSIEALAGMAPKTPVAQQQGSLGYKLVRVAATASEYAAYLQSEVGNHKAAARAWQHSASLSEQLVTRAQSASAPAKYVKYYREQASARWHRATYHWLAGGELDESTVSFQNAGQVLLNSPGSTFAGADEDAVIHSQEREGSVRARLTDSERGE